MLAGDSDGNVGYEVGLKDLTAREVVITKRES